jgi:hypothetical protein
MNIRANDIIFLLGAGASAEASIFTSAQMIEAIERDLGNKESRWNQYKDLYYQIKSAIYYSAGLKGHYGHSVAFNIETLALTLYELERNEEHTLYPFIATWNTRFVALAGENFYKIKELRRLILESLKSWISPDDTSAAEYYRNFVALQQTLNFPIHIFSLNYDLCIERLHSADFRVETGFAKYGPPYYWDQERFEDIPSHEPPQIYLYKLHGSMNWKRDPSTKDLYCVDQTVSVEPDKLQVIFGREVKLEALDPYLYYINAFRNYTRRARLIIVIGYGFGDDHINKLLSQALKADSNRRLLVVTKCEDDKEKDEKAKYIQTKIEPSAGQIVVDSHSAADFLKATDLIDTISTQMPVAPPQPF